MAMVDRWLLWLGCLLVFGCGARSGLPTPEPEDQSSQGGGGSPAEPSPCEPLPLLQLKGTVRDLSDQHPDFEEPFIGDDRGIVLGALGDDGTPQYAGERDNPSTHGEQAFFSWFHDVEGENLAQPIVIPLVPLGPGMGTFASDSFFPIDDALLGN